MHPFEILEAALSPRALHAYQAYMIAFQHGDPNMSVGELRTAIRRIYGEAVDQELERYLDARRAAVLPR